MVSALLLIDVQANMLQPPEPVPSAALVAPVIATILESARAAGAIVVHVRNVGGQGDPDAPGSPGWELIHPVLDGEFVVDKYEPDAFNGTALHRKLPIDADVVIVGMQSEYCIRSTSLSALHRGHRVFVVHGAHATYDDDVPAEQISLRVEQELYAAGATIVDAADVKFD